VSRALTGRGELVPSATVEKQWNWSCLGEIIGGDGALTAASAHEISVPVEEASAIGEEKQLVTGWGVPNERGECFGSGGLCTSTAGDVDLRALLLADVPGTNLSAVASLNLTNGVTGCSLVLTTGELPASIMHSFALLPNEGRLDF